MQLAEIQTENVYLGDRFRDEYGDIAELARDIQSNGMITPIAVKKTDESRFLLLAGGRRLAAAVELKMPTVPARIYDREINELDLRSIELAENLYRKDLEWLERVNLEREIHRLQVKIHGEKVSTSPGAPGHSLQDTADLLGRAKSGISASIHLADAAEAFPDLFTKCKTQHDATKIMKNLGQRMITESLAAKISEGKEKTSSGFNKLASCYINRDFFEGVKNIPDSSINLVEIDPPYAIKLPQAKKDYVYGDSYNEVDIDRYELFMSDVFKECYRTMAEHSWLICWFAPEPHFETIYQLIINAGFNAHRMCGVWIKQSGQSKRPEIHLANSYEMFFYAWKGRPALNTPGRVNTFDFPAVPPQQKTHPTERPVELMKDVYNTFAFPGSRVLIPFLGSGSGLIAANELGLAPIGFELSKSYRDSFLVKLHRMK